jgi:hypothetical protein
MILGYLEGQFVIADKLFDEIEVAEGVILKVIVMVLDIDLHKIDQLVVYLEKNCI